MGKEDTLLANLNPEQLHAVTMEDRNALILAGAGSGKTRVLTTRIAWLIREGRATEKSVLAVTFTNKAAKEMVERLCSIIPSIDPRDIWVGTFHGICNRMLRLNHEKSGLGKNFTIMDSQDQLSVIKRAMKGCNIDPDTYAPKDIQKSINDWKESGLRPKNIQPDSHLENVHLTVYANYENVCNVEKCADFAELLLRTVELLERDDALRELYHRKFSHILVDEFQDTNKMQYRWIRCLKGDSSTVMGVGDDDQSIYSFRGARVANMQDFINENDDVEVVKLERNYRSKKQILDAANAIIGHNSKRLGKNLKAENGAGERIRIRAAIDDRDESFWLADSIKDRNFGGVALSDIAVLYRSNAQSRMVEHALAANGISYRIYGGLRFFDRAEIKNAVAYLRLASNRDDNGAYFRAVNFPPRGIGNKTVENIAEHCSKNGISMFDAGNIVGGKAAKFNEIINRCGDAIQPDSLSKTVEDIIKISGLNEHYSNDKKEGEERIENLGELVSAATAFSVENGNDSLEEFLAYASLEAGERASGDEKAPSVQLMTVHASKGLEFDTVFLIGVEEKLFPHINSVSTQDGLEEERRLMYVAVTRAKEKLFVSHALKRMHYGAIDECLPSRFIAEIPEECMAQSGGTVRNFQPFVPKRFKTGQEIIHARFGKGTVISETGDGKKTFVKFKSGIGAGERWVFSTEIADVSR